jgi:hypothetical protein
VADAVLSETFDRAFDGDVHGTARADITEMNVFSFVAGGFYMLAWYKWITLAQAVCFPGG